MPILRIYLDTDGLLDLVTPESSLDEQSERVIETALLTKQLVFITSEITILESLVHACRNGNEKRQADLRRFLTPSSFVETCAETRTIIEDALKLRVSYGLKSPDAIHVATGLSTNCEAFLTKDEKWAKLGLSILSVSQLAKALGAAN